MLQISYKANNFCIENQIIPSFRLQRNEERGVQKSYEYQLVFVKTARGFTKYK